MIWKKIKMGRLIRTAIIVMSLSSMLIMSSSASVSALSLSSDRTVASVNDVNCAYDLNPLTWLICPIIDGMSALVEGFDTYITSALTINICTYFNSSAAGFANCGPNTQTNSTACVINSKTSQAVVDQCTSNGFYTAWQVFRDMALGLMVIGALIMVVSQIIGLEIFDAYTIRKVLPRIIIAAIGISLSWQLVQFLIQFSNDLGYGVRQLIYAPFQFLNSTGVIIKGGTSSAAFILGAGAIATLGIIATLTFVLVAVVAAFMGFAVIVLRQILIIFLALMAPLAIAMFILPATEKVWKLWWNTFFRALLMFPLIIGMIAIGRVFAALSSQTGGNVGQFIAFIAYFGPYFIIPSTFKFAGGILASAGGAASRFNKTASKTMSGYRTKKRKEIHEKRQAGDTRLTSGRSGNLYRRATTSGGLSPFAKGQSRFKAKDQLRTRALAENALKQDGGLIAGDDIATGLALQNGMTGGRFVEQYAAAYTADAAKRGVSVTPDQATAKARDVLSTMQTNFGTRMGSASMRVAAFKAKAASVSSYTGPGGLQQLYQDGGSMIRDGLMTSDAVAQSSKAAKARVDRSAIGYGLSKETFEKAATQSIDATDVKKLRTSAREGAKPSEFIGAHALSVDEMADPMVDDLKTALASGTSKDKYSQLANIDNIYSNLAATSPKIAEIFATKVMGQTVTGTGKNIRQIIDESKDNPEFKNFKSSFMMPGGPPTTTNESPPEEK